ncbi:hypothetical protein P3T24_007823 [Paraburkholderia sp. GAS33]|uniref:hypothetical protein n=1 Tax=Paraburkholderia sp. GAS33 TaxID=3035130 RepID=UPI003D1A8892
MILNILSYAAVFMRSMLSKVLALLGIRHREAVPSFESIENHTAANEIQKSIRKGRWLRHLKIASLLLILSYGPNNSTAKPSMESASTDETPLLFKLNGHQYKIPRNFLINMSDWSGGEQKDGVTIRLIYPGLKPYRKDNASCIFHKIKCRIYTIYMTSGHFSSEDTLSNLIANSAIHKTQKVGPYGFELFEIGPTTSRTNIYTKIAHGSPIFFDCVLYNIDHKSGGICHHFAHAVSGDALSYYFEMNDGLRDAVEVDGSIVNLIDRFLVKE